MAKRLKKSLGETLVEEGLITAEQLKKATQKAKQKDIRFGSALVSIGAIGEEDLASFVSEKLGSTRIELSNYIIDPKIIELIPEALARKHMVVPVLKIGKRLTCAMLEPWDVFAIDQLRAKTGLTIEPAVATEAEIAKVLSDHYGAKNTMEEIIQSIEQEEPEAETEDTKTLEDMAGEPAVVKLVNLAIVQAIQKGASDIHIEPEKDCVKVRFRIDGVLHEIQSPPKHLQSAIISRIKIMSSLDIAERRVPQDGRFSIKAQGKEIDIRVSCVPTIYGENVVLRLLDASRIVLDLKDIGFSKKVLSEYKQAIARPHGIILVTGPTGSGKTTTLYASLGGIDRHEKNIITIEDPVEARLDGIRQIQVNTKVDLSFATALRSVLRQDPDVIMVGEIRDAETAGIAIHAALTGHLVFSTLHTNNAAGAITRLIDMGAEPFLVSSSVVAVLAQRLVRKVCKDCKSKGCQSCLNTGYKGRVAVFELLIPDDKIRELITSKASAEEIEKQARSSGMLTLLEDGEEKVKTGITTSEEVIRVTQEE